MTLIKTTLLGLFLIACHMVSKNVAQTNVKTLNIIKKEASATASALRNLAPRNAQQKIQLASMASDLRVGLNLGTYSLNSALTSIFSEKDAQLVASATLTLSTLANDIQQVITEDPLKLKDKLATTAEEINKLGTRIATELSVPDPFIVNQINRIHLILIFALYKLKHQAKLFAKTNKELEAEIVTSIGTLVDVVAAIPSKDKTGEDLLRHVMHHLSVVKSRDVFRLKNWVEVNPSHEAVETIQGVAEQLSEIYDDLNSAVSKKYKAYHFKRLLRNSLRSSTKELVVLARLNTAGSVGEEEFIRATLFDDIAIGAAYAEIIGGAAVQP